MVSEIHTHWDIAFLEQYIGNPMVPRSLRWEVSPQKGELELLDWFQYFKKAGVKFLKFLVQRKNSELTHLAIEIKCIKDKMAPHTNSEEYKERSIVLKKNC